MTLISLVVVCVIYCWVNIQKILMWQQTHVPDQIQAVFQRQCRLVGRRFRLAHIMFGRDVIEVATFRASHSDARSENQAKQSDEGMLLRDNVYGTIEQDAERRDFTVNALYYDPQDNTLS